MRTVLKYPGSKWNIASKLVELIPEHHSYNKYLASWEKMQFSSCAEHGKPRTETVWMNYRADLQMNFEDFPEVIP